MALRQRLRRIVDKALNVSSLVVLMSVMGGMFFFITYDIFLWVRQDLRVMASVGASLSVLVLGSLLLLSSRKIGDRTAFADIPKLYVPINRSDLPKPVFELVQAGLARAATIRANAVPLPEQLPDAVGWGKPGTLFDGMHFKTAAIGTLALLEAEVSKFSDRLRRDPRMTVFGYVRFLINHGVIAEDIAWFYVERYEAVRFGPDEMSESEYREFMKIFTALLRSPAPSGVFDFDDGDAAFAVEGGGSVSLLEETDDNPAAAAATAAPPELAALSPALVPVQLSSPQGALRPVSPLPTLEALDLTRTGSSGSDLSADEPLPQPRNSFVGESDQVLDIHNFAAPDAENDLEASDSDDEASASLPIHGSLSPTVGHVTTPAAASASVDTPASDHVPSAAGTPPHNARRKVTLADFTLLKVIGRGAYGKVFLVRRRDPQLHHQHSDPLLRAPLLSAAGLPRPPRTSPFPSATADPVISAPDPVPGVAGSALPDPVADATSPDAPHGVARSGFLAVPSSRPQATPATAIPGRRPSAAASMQGSSPGGHGHSSARPHHSHLFAMKVLRKASIVVRGREAEQTRNERSILEAVRHPFIVKLFYAFQTDEKLYLILSYASGGELFTYLAKERMFSEDVACFYMSELLLAVEHLHGLGIIYRDLKPENVLLDSEGHVVLTDFGLSKVAVNANTVCGTVEFMAPEVLDEKLEYGKAVDYWSLGVMLFDMLTGAPPFSGGNRKKIMESILKKKPNFPKYMTANARDLCTKLLKKIPEQRLGSGADGAVKVKAHMFFRKVDWKLVLARGVAPPYVPALSAPDDTSHFLKDFTSMPLSDSPPVPGETGLRASQNEKFLGFSYVADSMVHMHA